MMSELLRTMFDAEHVVMLVMTTMTQVMMMLLMRRVSIMITIRLGELARSTQQ